jgi:hypothetical protein
MMKANLRKKLFVRSSLALCEEAFVGNKKFEVLHEVLRVWTILCTIYGYIESICIQPNIFVSGCLLMATIVGAEEEEDAL